MTEEMFEQSCPPGQSDCSGGNVINSVSCEPPLIFAALEKG